MAEKSVSTDSLALTTHAQYKGKMYPVEDIVDSKKPAHEGGGNHYKLTGVGLVHQNDIENLVHESEMKKSK